MGPGDYAIGHFAVCGERGPAAQSISIAMGNDDTGSDADFPFAVGWIQIR